MRREPKPDRAPMILARLGANALPLQELVVAKLFALTDAKADKAKIRKAKRELDAVIKYVYAIGAITEDEVPVLLNYRIRREEK